MTAESDRARAVLTARGWTKDSFAAKGEIDEIARESRAPKSVVYRLIFVLRHHVEPRRERKLLPRVNKVIELLKAGKSRADIAEACKVTTQAVSSVRLKYGEQYGIKYRSRRSTPHEASLRVIAALRSGELASSVSWRLGLTISQVRQARDKYLSVEERAVVARRELAARNAASRAPTRIALNLLREGRSYAEIEKKTGVARATLYALRCSNKIPRPK